MAKQAKKNGKAVPKKNGHSDLKFWGWRRKNGRVGVRNHVVILPLDDLSNAAASHLLWQAARLTLRGRPLARARGRR